MNILLALVNGFCVIWMLKIAFTIPKNLPSNYRNFIFLTSIAVAGLNVFAMVTQLSIIFS